MSLKHLKYILTEMSETYRNNMCRITFFKFVTNPKKVCISSSNFVLRFLTKIWANCLNEKRKRMNCSKFFVYFRRAQFLTNFRNKGQ